MASPKLWPALVLRAGTVLSRDEEDAIAALLDDFSPTAIQDFTTMPLPPGGLWDPTPPTPPDVSLTPLEWRVFFTSSEDRDAAAKALESTFPSLALASESVADEDWAARSQRELTAVRAGRFIVAPPWDVPRDTDATVVIIEPSRGFGTGHHASTRLCLQALSEVDTHAKRVVDLGTGSGVLAMAAILSGAKHVIAIDVDPDAIDSARESARLNPRVPNIHWLVGDFRNPGWDVLSGGPFDLVLANLTAGMLTSSAERIRELVGRDGVLICSGFDERESASVESALSLPCRARYTEDEWTGLTLQAR